MRILIVTPARRGSRQGNRVTALRWQAILRGLGHRVTVAERYRGEPADLLIALHARKSAEAVAAFARRRPGRPIVVSLTGTDIYEGRLTGPALTALRRADRLVALQPLAGRRLPRALRSKLRVILQSAEPPAGRARRGRDFQVAVIGHLRTVKDPLRAALAVRALPPASRVRIVHLGRALTPAWAQRARAEMARNPRYRWRGEAARATALRTLAAARLLVISSRSEGGANVVTEAAALGVPVLASRVDGNVGLLGPRYPGLFPLGDTRALRALLLRAEGDPGFLARLRDAMAGLRRRSTPAAERRGWQALLSSLEASREAPRPWPAGAKRRKGQ